MRLLCIGDSNTYGYDPRSYFGSRYPADICWTNCIAGWEVNNCGMNGLTIPSDGRVWQNLVESKKPDLVAVMLGSNDLLEGSSAETASNRMEAFLERLLEEGKPILLIAPPPMQAGAWVSSERPIEESRKLGKLYRAVAKRLKTDFADAGEWNIELAYDGVHFTESGHRAFAAGLNRHLNGGKTEWTSENV